MDNRYAVQSVVAGIHGDGAYCGRKAVRVQFSGCNLWSGVPHQRTDGASMCATWCDSNFAQGKVLDLEQLLEVMDSLYPLGEQTHSLDGRPRLCVLTGGEPLQQVNGALINELHGAGWRIILETNGTISLPASKVPIEHVVVSPQRGMDDRPLPLAVTTAQELRVVVPGVPAGVIGGWTDAELLAVADRGYWDRLYVQPQDVLVDPESIDCTVMRLGAWEVTQDMQPVVELAAHVAQGHVTRCITFVMMHPRWQLATQVDKLMGR